MLSKNKYLLLILLTGCLINSFLPYLYSTENSYSLPFDFYREHIIISIENNVAVVEGYYYLENMTGRDQELALFYPFFIDNYLSYPETITVFEKRWLFKRNRIDFIRQDKGIIWHTSIKANSKKCIRVNYLQKITNNSFTYILTSTKYWKKNLGKATYLVIVPKELKNINLSYVPDKIIIRNNKSYYYITKNNFMPALDLTTSWGEQIK